MSGLLGGFIYLLLAGDARMTRRPDENDRYGRDCTLDVYAWDERGCDGDGDGGEIELSEARESETIIKMLIGSEYMLKTGADCL